MKEKIQHELFSWVKILFFAFILSQVISKGIIVNATIPSASMEMTIMTGDRLFANRLAYTFDEPERGDIITFVSREDENKLYIKRLIGLPGERVEIIGGDVYVDDIKLIEPYLNPIEDNGNYGPYLVPEDHYFFLGDNRDNSSDARFWDNPYIAKEDLVGKAVMKYFPSIDMIEKYYY